MALAPYFLLKINEKFKELYKHNFPANITRGCILRPSNRPVIEKIWWISWFFIVICFYALTSTSPPAATMPKTAQPLESPPPPSSADGGEEEAEGSFLPASPVKVASPSRKKVKEIINWTTMLIFLCWIQKDFADIKRGFYRLAGIPQIGKRLFQV